MIHVEFFCSRCNPSCQRRDPGDELGTRGYRKAEMPSAFRGSGHVRAPFPPGWTEVGKMLICDICIDAADTSELIDAATSAASDGAWPSRVSPFATAEPELDRE